MLLSYRKWYSTYTGMKSIEGRFYRTPAGNEPVHDWLRGLSDEDKKIVGTDIMKVEMGWPIGMPACRPIGGGLHEIRSTIKKGKVEARIYFDVTDRKMLMLNAHEGKDDQQSEISTARDRLKDHISRQAKPEVKKD